MQPQPQLFLPVVFFLQSIDPGTVDFFTDDKLVSANSKVVFMINNFELIQIIFLDNKIADHFHNFPLYGIIDSIEIKN